VGTVLAGVSAAATFSADLYEAADALDTNSESLAAWGLLVDKTGGSLAAFEQTLGAVATQFGRSNAEILATLPDLADLFKSLPKEIAFRLGGKLGIDDSTIRLLIKGREEVLKLLEANRKYTVGLEESGNIAESLRQTFKTTSNEFALFSRTIADLALPVLEGFLKILNQAFAFLNSHPALIKALTISFGILAGGLALVVAAGAVFLTVFTAVGLQVVAIIGVFTALAVVGEDIYSFFKGIPSVLGDSIAWIKEFGQSIKTWIVDTLQEAIDLWNALTGTVKNILSGNFSELSLSYQPESARKQYDVPALAPPSLSLISEGSSSSNQTVNITGPITVTTEATDAQGVAEGLGGWFKRNIQQAVSSFDDGVRA